MERGYRQQIERFEERGVSRVAVQWSLNMLVLPPFSWEVTIYQLTKLTSADTTLKTSFIDLLL